jgi:uncharacterized protein YeaO (DUF488 family)
MSDTPKHSMWVDVGKQVLSFVVGVVVAAFVLGRGIQKINAISEWKTEVAPKIERMDSVGSLSFDHFHKQYEKDQARHEARLKELENEVKELQLERKINDVGTSD